MPQYTLPSLATQMSPHADQPVPFSAALGRSRWYARSMVGGVFAIANSTDPVGMAFIASLGRKSVDVIVTVPLTAPGNSGGQAIASALAAALVASAASETPLIHDDPAATAAITMTA